MCLAGGFSCPPMAVIACTVSAVRISRCARLRGGYRETTSELEKGWLLSELSLSEEVDGGLPPVVSGRRERRPFMIPLKRGALLYEGE